MIRINKLTRPTKKILFLGCDRDQSKLIDALVSNNCVVDYTIDKVEPIKGYDCVMAISTGTF